MLQGVQNSSGNQKTKSSTMRGDQVFLSVIYDFEYLSEEGKRVYMKENEILLLISKTNHDWWQVIRRGDRRPFYAPAKYVVELRPADLDAAHRREAKTRSTGGNISWQYSRNKNRPLFTTFGGGGGGPVVGSIPAKESLPAYSKRHSIASPGSRFHERYRSNSLDSILIGDLERPQAPSQTARHSYHINSSTPAFHLYPAEQHLIPKSQVTLIRGGVGLSKRPTIEGLDKRKSWSLDISGRVTSSHSSIVSSQSGALHSNVVGAGSRPGSRISAYQNTDALVGVGTRENKSSKNSTSENKNKKKPVPLPRSKIPVQEKSSAPSQTQPLRFFQRSKTDLTSDSLAKYNKGKRSPEGISPTKYPAPKVPVFNRPVPQKRSSHTGSSAEERSAASTMPSRGQRPAVKEKPSFSTFKTKKTETPSEGASRPARSSEDEKSEPKISRAASEGDILGQLIEESETEIQAVIDEMKFERHTNADSDFAKPRSEPLTITSQPLIDKTSEVSEWMDRSCSTSYESTDGSTLLSNTAERSTDVSMEDQDLFSLESCGQLGSGQNRSLMSPCSTSSRSPPSPAPGMSPQRIVSDEWEEYEDAQSGRMFYFHPATKEKSWKPPRKSKGSSEGYSAPTSPCPDSVSAVDDVKVETDKKVPDGYELKTTDDIGSSYFVNVFTGVKWFSAETESGKVYFYEENGNESCWALPNVSQSIQDTGSNETLGATGFDDQRREQPPKTKEDFDNVEFRAVHQRLTRPVTAMPALSSSRATCDVQKLPVSTPNFQIGKVNIVILKQGPLHKTKLVENGKKHRKNWTNSHVVLTDTFLLFFKDAKTFALIQSGGFAKPDHCIDLKGASVEWCSSDKSKRSNVFEVTTPLLGMAMLLQDSDASNAMDWFRNIRQVADRLSQRVPDTPDPSSSRTGQQTSTLQLPAKKSVGGVHSKVNRTTSLKLKFLGSGAEVEGVTPGPPSAGVVSTTSATNKGNIREKLRKFFLRRPAMDDLFRRGIMKNEPVFGSTLRELQATDLSDVPLFVKKCIAEIEKGELLKTDGVYRQSGNLSHIQKIRLQVDQGNLAILETVDDVHVLTGALKLFFRELKEPLILWEIVDKLLLACNHQSKKVKLKQMRDCVMSLPQAHKATLQYLLRHLVRVTEFKELNRMQIPNLAIVFGPTLMWPPPSLVSHNLALSMMQQNIIVEALLINIEVIFAKHPA